MTVLANTLNAYAAKLKAQRKAAEREAQAQARAKSAEQKLADKMRIEAAKLEKEQQQNKRLFSTTRLVDIYLDKVTKKFKTQRGLEFNSGERAQVRKDLLALVELYYYTGPVPGGKAYKVIDASKYSITAFEILISVIGNLDMAKEHNLRDVIKYNFRRIVVFKSNNGSTVTFTPVDITLDQVKAQYDKLNTAENHTVGVATYISHNELEAAE
jgi:hypothetical protein